MKRHMPLVGLLGLVWGCEQPITPDGKLYRPGQKLLLVLRTEMEMTCTGLTDGDEIIVETRGPDSRIVKRMAAREAERQETSVRSIEWGQMELALEVEQADVAGRVAISLRYRRQRGGASFRSATGHSGAESIDTAKPPTGDEGARKEWEDRVAAMKAVSFSAVAKEPGQVVAFDARGKPYDSLKRELAGENASTEQRDLSLRFHSMGVFSALADAAAYLPPRGVRPGQAWLVRRERVFPYHAYAFSMVTHGCVFSRERSRCLAESVKQTLFAGRVATIRITGLRVPQHPEGGMPRRVSHMTVTGTLRFNLDRAEVIDLRLESTPYFLKAEDRRAFAVKFVDSVQLTRPND